MRRTEFSFGDSLPRHAADDVRVTIETSTIVERGGALWRELDTEVVSVTRGNSRGATFGFQRSSTEISPR